MDIGRAIVSQGWQSVVVSQGGRMVEPLVKSGSSHVILPVASKNPFKIIFNAIQLVKIIRRKHILLIHARSRAPAWSALIAAKVTGIPFVTTYHGAYSQRSRLKALYNSVMVRSNVTIANSHWTAERIRSGHPSATSQVIVVHRGTDFSKFSEGSVTNTQRKTLRLKWRTEADQPVILLLARLTSWKGQATLIDAAPKVLRSYPNAMFILAGDDQGRSSYRNILEERIQELGIMDNIHLPGHCNEPATAFSVCDVTIVASNRPEAFGRAAVEAQALQVPVIATDIGAVGETVLAPPQVKEDQRTGWKIPPSDPEAMADAILTALSLDSEKRALMVRRARKHVEANFSVEQMRTKTLEIYRNLLDIKL